MAVRVVAHHEKPLTYYDERGELTGLSMDILNDLQLNRGIVFNITKLISYNTTELFIDSRLFFQRDIAATLVSNAADLAVSYYYFLYNRVNHNLSILLPVVSERFRAFFVQPHVTNESSIYLAPFGTKIAILIYSFVLILVFLASVILFMSNKQSSENNSFIASCRAGIWTIVSSYALKSYPLPTKSFPIQVFFISSNLLFWVLSSLYTAYLMSLLSSSLEPIHTFTDLIAHDYSITLNPLVSSSENGYYKKPSKRIERTIDSFKAAFDGGHAHVDAQDAFMLYADTLGMQPTDMCSKIKVLPFLSGISSGFYVSRNYNKSLKESINRGIARIGEVGILKYYSSNFFTGYVPSCPRPSSGYLELDMVHVGRLFKALITSVAVSTAIMGIELLCIYFTKSQISSRKYQFT